MELLHLIRLAISCWIVTWASRFMVVRGKVFATQMSNTVIDTQYGKLRGLLISQPPNRGLSPVEAYFGLQYASLLGNELRFMPPTSSMEKWDNVRVTIKYRAVCPQRLPTMEELSKKMPTGRVEYFKRIIPFLEKQSEDCLNLNLYVPVKDKNVTSGLFPVIVFIHGESFELGSGNAYDGSVMASVGQVIVVTINYRLGPLGFLSTGDSNAPGNYAVLDIVAALHWVKENIQAFSGDPNSVTLLGHGYGGALVNILMISPVTKGRHLFQRAIILSGSAFSTRSVTNDPLQYALALGAALNCTTPSSTPPSSNRNAALVHCLKQQHADDLVKVEIPSHKYFSAFGPTVDRRSVLPGSVRHLATRTTNSVFATTKLLLGVTHNEGLIWFRQQDIEEGITPDRLRQIMRTYVQNVYQYHRQYILDILTHQYTDWDRPIEPATLRDSAIDLIGDAQYVAPIIELAQAHSRLNGAATYMYSFNYLGRMDSYPRWAGGIHGDDLAFAFGAPLIDGLEPFTTFTKSKSDRDLAETLLKYLTNFAKTGNPNDHGGRIKGKSFNDSNWPVYDLERQQLLMIEREMQDRINEGRKPPIRHHYRAAKMALWLELIPKLHKSDNLDPKFHFLDNSDNLTTFERDGTKHVNTNELSSVTSTTPDPGTTTATPSISTSPTSIIPTQATTTLLTDLSSFPDAIAQPSTPNNVPYVGKDLPVTASDEIKDADGSSIPLKVTIVVGCSLLFLNIMIFVAMFYQKVRLRRERMLMKMDIEHEQEMMAKLEGTVDVVNCKTKPLTTAPYAYTNSSSSPPRIPPIPLAFSARNNISFHQHTLPPPAKSLPAHVTSKNHTSGPIYAATISTVGRSAVTTDNHVDCPNTSRSATSNSKNGGPGTRLTSVGIETETSVDRTVTGHCGNPSTVV